MDIIQPPENKMPYRRWCQRRHKVCRRVSLLPLKEMHFCSSRSVDSLCPPGLAQVLFVYKKLSNLKLAHSVFSQFPVSCTFALCSPLFFSANPLFYASLAIPATSKTPSDQDSMTHFSFPFASASHWRLVHT